MLETHQRKSVPSTIPGPLPPVNTAAALVTYLGAIGVDTVFGVPGGPIMGMYEALSQDSRMRVVLCKHEQGAVFAAYGYASESRKLGVVVVTSGPGVTNALAGLGSAYRDAVPILVIGGQVSSERIGCGAAQDSSPFGVDVVSMAKSVTTASVALGSAVQVARLMPGLVASAWHGKRPVFVQLSADVLSLPGRTICAGRTAPWDAPPGPYDAEAAERALALCCGRPRVALLVGSGARDMARPALVCLAERLGAAVASTPRAKGVFPEDHPLSVGVFGFAGTSWASHVVLDAGLDALIVLGSGLGELASDGWNAGIRPRALVHVDRDPTVIGGRYPAVPVVGELAAVVAHWNRRLPERSDQAFCPAWLRHIQTTTPRVRAADLGSAMNAPMRPERIMAELEACLPANALVVSDIGNCMAYFLHHVRLKGEQSFMANLGMGSMGHSPGAALGAYFANPKRPVVAVMGDAAFAMNGFEVHTAVEFRPRGASFGGPVYIVLNNGGNGMVEAGVRAQFGPDSGIDTGQFRTRLDVSQIAAGLGADTVCVHAPGQLEAAMQLALAPGRGPTVIEVMTAQGTAPPMGARVAVLKRFVADGQGSQS